MNPDVEAEVLARFGAPRTVPPDPPRGPLLESTAYHDSGWAAREHAAVFARAWLPVARTSELAVAGDVVAADVGPVPLIAARDEAGTTRVLRNVCVHRGAQLVRERCSRHAALRCPYHGFEYGLDGALCNAPVPLSFPERGRPGHARLAEVRSGTFGGFVWACLDESAPPLAEALGPALVDELVGYPLDTLSPVVSRVDSAEFDWKVGVEAFLEPLHVPAIHPRSAHTLVDFRGIAMRGLGEHSRMALPFRAPGAFSPDGVLGAAALAAGVESFPGLCRVQREAHLVYHVFPSLVLMLFPNHALTLRFFPAGVGRTQLLWEVSALPAASPAGEAWRESLAPGYERLVAEDLANLPWIQRGLASGTFVRPILSGYEARIAHFHAAVAARVVG